MWFQKFMNKKEIKQKYEFTKRDYWWIFILLIVWSVCDYFLKISHQIRPDFIANMLAFLSITNWFYITSLAMFAGSDFLKKLYNTNSETNSKHTLLHDLLATFSFPFYFGIWTIAYLLVCHIIITPRITSDHVIKYGIEWYFLLAIPAIICINFFTITKSFKIFKAFVKKSWE